MTTSEHSLLHEDEHLRASLEQGYTLPANWYLDPALFAREACQIFRRTWQYAGLTEQIRQPGDFFTCTVDTVPLLITRDEAGDIQAFVNVCRHRGSELVLQDCGTRSTFQCHYHAWTYNLDGTLRAAPGMKYEADFDPGHFSLQRVQAETWGPFIFITLAPDAPPLQQMLGELPDLLLATGVQLMHLKRRVRQVYEIAANWKVVIDNYLECYHCPVAHPGFSAVIDTHTYTVREYEYFSTQGGPQKAQAGADRAPQFNTQGSVSDGFFAYLWPNFTLNLYPGPGNLSLNLFLPRAVDKTLAIFDYLFADDVSADDQEQFSQFIDQVQREDIVLCESVQRGLRSGYIVQGKLMLHQEKALRHFQRLVYRSLVQ